MNDIKISIVANLYPNGGVRELGGSDFDIDVNTVESKEGYSTKKGQDYTEHRLCTTANPEGRDSTSPFILALRIPQNTKFKGKSEENVLREVQQKFFNKDFGLSTERNAVTGIYYIRKDLPDDIEEKMLATFREIVNGVPTETLVTVQVGVSGATNSLPWGKQMPLSELERPISIKLSEFGLNERCYVFDNVAGVEVNDDGTQCSFKIEAVSRNGIYEAKKDIGVRPKTLTLRLDVEGTDEVNAWSKVCLCIGENKLKPTKDGHICLRGEQIAIVDHLTGNWQKIVKFDDSNFKISSCLFNKTDMTIRINLEQLLQSELKVCINDIGEDLLPHRDGLNCHVRVANGKGTEEITYTLFSYDVRYLSGRGSLCAYVPLLKTWKAETIVDVHLDITGRTTESKRVKTKDPHKSQTTEVTFSGKDFKTTSRNKVKQNALLLPILSFLLGVALCAGFYYAFLKDDKGRNAEISELKEESSKLQKQNETLNDSISNLGVTIQKLSTDLKLKGDTIITLKETNSNLTKDIVSITELNKKIEEKNSEIEKLKKEIGELKKKTKNLNQPGQTQGNGTAKSPDSAKSKGDTTH